MGVLALLLAGAPCLAGACDLSVDSSWPSSVEEIPAGGSTGPGQSIDGSESDQAAALPTPGAFQPLPARSESSSTARGDAAFEDHTWSRTGLFKRVLSDQKFLMTTWWPSEFKNTAFSAPLLAGVAAAALSRGSDGFDQRLTKSANDASQGNVTTTAHAFSTLGNAAPAALLIGTAYLIGRTTHNDRLRETASLSAEALLDAGIYITVLKGLTARTRPSGGGTGEFFQYSVPSDQSNGSFPSGHAFGSFAVATVIARQYADTKWVPWAIYGTAGLVSLSRVIQARHYPSDIIVGAVLGNSMGRMVVSRAHGEKPSIMGQLQPIYDPQQGAYGIAWNYEWTPGRK